MSKKNDAPGNTGGAAPERTKRGDEDRKKEDDEMTGKPVTADDDAAQPEANVTRDKSVTPAKDNQKQGGGKKS